MRHLRRGQGRSTSDGFHLVSMGWTNPTPWDTFREAPEDELAEKIEAVASQIPDMGRAIFNFHAPPYGTGLDEAPALDETLRPTHGGAVMKPVGSTAVRDAIINHQPMLSVHGHIHESRGDQDDGPDAGHQSRQRLRRRRPAGRRARAERQEGEGHQVPAGEWLKPAELGECA